jgi:PIN domain nuclease of toxin-antitoxin system
VSRYVTDTHALYWHLTNDPRLSPGARQVFHEADVGLHQILVPGIALIEMVYLVERGRLDADLVDRVFILLDTIAGSYAVASLDQGTARALRDVPRSVIPDLPDRVIVATARQLGLPLITRDAKIHNAGVVPLIW